MASCDMNMVVSFVMYMQLCRRVVVGIWYVAGPVHGHVVTKILEKHRLKMENGEGELE